MSLNIRTFRISLGKAFYSTKKLHNFYKMHNLKSYEKNCEFASLK